MFLLDPSYRDSAKVQRAAGAPPRVEVVFQPDKP
jgi:hypothetical protein